MTMKTTSNHLKGICSMLLVAMLCLAACEKVLDLEELTIDQIHSMMESGEITAEQLVTGYLARIQAYDKNGPYINSIITVNPNALDRARELDIQYQKSGFSGPLHGIPMVVKDNYDTFDLPTTNGTLAFKGFMPPNDAFQIKKIREAGAIILGKTNLAEFASSGAFTVSSVLPGYTRNPYDLRRVTAGSSGGTAAAIAANFAVLGLGTDTGSSIRGPSSHQSLVGFRTTMGLSSRDGIAPLNLSRDIGGPMARTVTDAAILLNVISGPDPADSITALATGHIPDNYTHFLNENDFQGKRIGVLRQLFQEPDPQLTGPEPAAINSEEPTNPQPPTKVHPEVLRLMNRALDDMTAAGAQIIDSVTIPHLDSLQAAFPSIPRLRYDFENYLSSRPELPHQSLREILESGDYHPYLRYNLTQQVQDSLNPSTHKDYPSYLQAQTDLQTAVLDLMDSYDLDALAYPTYNYPPRLTGDLNTIYGANSSSISPPTGFPAFNVPMGFSFGSLPAGLQLLGRPFGEPTLLTIAYGYEQATKHRRRPPTTPALK
tara:strand:+ start:9741 stop:11372 length:1632 start_codon:yes stop_codon:yes gene_type:complete